MVQIAVFFIYNYFQKIISEWKPYMAIIFCKKCFLFQVETKEKLILKLKLIGPSNRPNQQIEFQPTS